MQREPNTEYILSLSYGKDSIACLEAIKQLGYPLDRIVHAEVWATDTIPADLPPMVDFKSKADKIILDRYGIAVEHIYATRAVKREREREQRTTYERQFYTFRNNRKYGRELYGFPCTRYPWCNSKLKVDVLQSISKSGEGDIRETVLSYPDSQRELVQQQSQTRQSTGFQYQSAEETGVRSSNRGFSSSPIAQGAKKNIVQYLGIAADEPERIKRHSVPGKVLPLVDIGWDESYCRKWCEENDLLSPIYTTATRGGCWFCHNQGVDQLRLLRRDYPELWQLLLKWDLDSPTTFKSDGHTVHDFDIRFEAEDKGLIKAGDRKFRWKSILEKE